MKNALFIIGFLFVVAVWLLPSNSFAQQSDWSCKCSCPCQTPGAVKSTTAAPVQLPPPPAAYVAPSAPAAPAPSAAYQPAAPAASAYPTGISDSRSQPVDMRFAPPEAYGRPSPAKSTYTGAAPSYTPSPPVPAYTPPPSVPSYAPPPPPVMTAVPPAPTAPAAGGTAYQPHYTDLPKGWDEPSQLPPGSIRLEDLQGRPIATGVGAPDAAPAPAPGAFQSPAAAPPYPPIQQTAPSQPVEEIISDTMPGETKPPPSRWGN